MDSLTKRSGCPFGRGAMTILAGLGLSLDFWTMVAIRTCRGISIGMGFVVIFDRAELRMVALRARRFGQGLLVAVGKYGIEFRRMARTTRQRGRLCGRGVMMAYHTVFAHSLDVLHVPYMRKDNRAAFIFKTNADRQLV